MVGRVSGAIRTKGIVFLVEVPVLWIGSQSLVDVPGESRIGHLNARSNRVGTFPALETSDVHRQVAAQRQIGRIHLVRNNVQGGKVSALGTNIRHADREIGCDLALHIQIPRLNVRGTPTVRRNLDHAVAPILALGSEWSGGRENVGHAVVDLDGTAVGWADRLPVKESQAVLIGERSLFQRLVENPVTAAQDCLVVDAIGEAQPRPERFSVDILGTRPSIPTRPASKISVSSRNIAGAGIGKGWVDHGKPMLGLRGRYIDVVAQAVVQGEARCQLVSVLAVEGEIFVSDSAKVAIVQGGGVHQAEERTRDRFSAHSSIAGLGGIKIEFTGSLGQAPHVELQHADFAAELEIVPSLDPAHGIVYLEDVVGKLRIAAIVQSFLVRIARKFDTGESSVRNSCKPNLLRISLTQAI